MRTERLTLNMSQATRNTLEAVQQQLGLANVSETIRLAVSLLDGISTDVAAGAELYLHYPDGREVHIVVVL